MFKKTKLEETDIDKQSNQQIEIQSEQIEIPSGWETYKDKEYGFEIQYPKEGFALLTGETFGLCIPRYPVLRRVNVYAARIIGRS